MVAASTLVAPVLVVMRSTCGVMVVINVLVLLALLVSVIPLVAVAVLVNVPLAGAVTVTVKFVVELTAKLLRAGQPTTPLALVPPALALTKVTVAGNVSLTLTLVAVEGPALVTVMV